MRWLLLLFVGFGLTTVLLADEPKEPQREEKDDSVEDEELDMLKRAFKRHKEELEEEQKLGRESESLNPLEQVLGKMGVVERRLGRSDVGKHTQKKQIEIVKILEDLIRQIEEQPQPDSQSPSSGRKKGKKKQQDGKKKKNRMNRQMQDPNRSRNAQPGSQRQKKVFEKVMPPEEKKLLSPKGGKETDRWGTLKERDREDADAASKEKFHPKYRRILEEYYKELSKPKERR